MVTSDPFEQALILAEQDHAAFEQAHAQLLERIAEIDRKAEGLKRMRTLLVQREMWLKGMKECCFQLSEAEKREPLSFLLLASQGRRSE